MNYKDTLIITGVEAIVEAIVHKEVSVKYKNPPFENLCIKNKNVIERELKTALNEGLMDRLSIVI